MTVLSFTELHKLADEADTLIHTGTIEQVSDFRDRGLAFVDKSQIVWQELKPMLEKDIKKEKAPPSDGA